MADGAEQDDDVHRMGRGAILNHGWRDGPGALPASGDHLRCCKVASTGVRLRRVGAALLLAGMAVLPRAATAAEPVVVPTFIDPHLHLDKPDADRPHAIRFLTTDDNPPFNFLAPDGTLVGFNVDLARAVCAVLDAVCTIQARSFENLVPALDASAGDAVIASLAITPASRAAVTFTLPTMRMAARFAARNAGASSPAATLPGDVLPETVGRLVIGVQGGTAHEAFLRQFFPQAVVKTFTDPDSLHAALRSGAVDLVFADGLATALWLNGSTAAGCCHFAGGPFTDDRYFGEGTAIAVRRTDLPLKEALDYALQRLSINGTAADLYLKYFPLGFF